MLAQVEIPRVNPPGAIGPGLELENAKMSEQAPRIVDRCPTCGAQSLFVGAGGYLTCSVIDCKAPAVGEVMALNAAASATLERWREREAACCPEDAGFDEVIREREITIHELRYVLEQIKWCCVRGSMSDSIIFTLADRGLDWGANVRTPGRAA